jgi:hypothetical protein
MNARLYKRSIRVPIVQQRGEKTLATFIGLAVFLLISFAVCGCRDMTTTATALDAANKALVVVDVATDTAVETIRIAREERIAACRAQNLPTPTAREACLGPLAEPLAPKAEAAAEAYDATVKALEELAQAIEAIETMAREVGAEQ